MFDPSAASRPKLRGGNSGVPVSETAWAISPGFRLKLFSASERDGQDVALLLCAHGSVNKFASAACRISGRLQHEHAGSSKFFKQGIQKTSFFRQFRKSLLQMQKCGRVLHFGLGERILL